MNYSKCKKKNLKARNRKKYNFMKLEKTDFPYFYQWLNYETNSLNHTAKAKGADTILHSLGIGKSIVVCSLQIAE